jgi:hypothetical protein
LGKFELSLEPRQRRAQPVQRRRQLRAEGRTCIPCHEPSESSLVP